MDNYEIVIKPDGGMWRRRLNEEEIDIDAGLASRLASGVVIKVKNVATLDGVGPVHLAAKSNGSAWWTVVLNSIPLKTYYDLRNGVVVPVFRSNGDDPLFRLTWQKPENMELKLVVNVNNYEVGESFLFAYCEAGKCWRVPLANIYETGKLCLGNDRICGLDAFDCLKKALHAFSCAQWNADLLMDLSKTERFFRFKPDNEKFETLPIDADDWTSLCVKLSVPAMEVVC